jgi:3-hydroxybutyryl-CoA dehydrogenase
MSHNVVAVVGLGLLGRGIATCLLNNGYHVIGCDQSPETLAAARCTIAEFIGELASRPGADASIRDSWPSLYTDTLDIAEIAPVSFIIESVTEDPAIKQSMFDRLENVVAPTTPIASNTSAIPISVIQQGRRFPGRFLGMHWAAPAYDTKFLELIKGDQTGETAFNRAVEIANACNKEPCLVHRDVPGFIANRLGYAIYREAFHLLATGVADAETIDRAFRNSVGLWAGYCGPLRWIDLTGGPEFYAQAMAPVLPTLNADGEVPPLLARLANEGAQGIVSGHGLFDYADDDATAWLTGFHAYVRKLALLKNDT